MNTWLGMRAALRALSHSCVAVLAALSMAGASWAQQLDLREITYSDTSLTDCPDGEKKKHFWIYEDVELGRSDTWCGTAQADIDWANATDPETWRLPYILESCVAGDYWTYSHAQGEGNPRYYSGQLRGINLICLIDPPPPPSTDSTPQPPTAGDEPPSGPPDGMCLGNPIVAATGEKILAEIDYMGEQTHPLRLVRSFRSRWGGGVPKGLVVDAGLGIAWSHNHAVSISQKGTPSSASWQTLVNFGDGEVRSFNWSTTTSAWLGANSADTLVSGSPGLLYTRRTDDSKWQFDAAGRLLSRTERNGWVMGYTYSTSGTTTTSAPLVGLLTSVSNQFTKTLTFSYNGNGQLLSVSTPDSQTISYTYDGFSSTPGSFGRLGTATYPGSTSGTVSRAYLYEDSNYPEMVTGIVGEDGNRYSTYEYDSYGRATSTRLDGVADWYAVVYGSSVSGTGTVTITVGDPLDTLRSYTYNNNGGQLAVVAADLPSATGNPDAASRVQDSNGLVTQKTDFQGVQTSYSWDSARQLPLVTTQAVGLTETRTISTQWHNTWTLPVLTTETGRVTAYTYDGNGDRLTQAVGDSTAGTTRTWAWTYNAQKLPATAIEPNGATTTFAYDTSGNLGTMTNALGHVTTFTYDSGGRVTQQTEPTGRVTTYGYDLRGRLAAQTTTADAITLTYNVTGTVAGLRQKNGRTVTFAYDGSHRLIGWQDNNGVTVSYALDPLGNRLSETIGDANGAAWQIGRTFDDIGRMDSEYIGAYIYNEYGYDANGERISFTDGVSQTTAFGLDALRRLKAITNPLSATATLAYNNLDAITQAVDFKGVATSYTRNGYGEATVESSADIGTQTRTFSSLGLPTTFLNSLAQATTISYDLLGRPTQVTYQGGATSTLAYDLTGTTYNATGFPDASKGYLSRLIDRSGTTTFQRDGQSRVVQRVWTPPSVTGLTLSYAYNSVGQLSTLTYPGSGVLTYVYGTAGRITGMNWNGSALVSSITYNAAEQPTSWSWNFTSSIPATRSYDLAGNLTANGIASYLYDDAGKLEFLTEYRLVPGDSNPANSTTATNTLSWTASYDGAGRVTGFSSGAGTTTFAYDANGNRATATMVVGTATTVRTYTITAGTNKITGYTQVTNATGSSVTSTVSYSLNAIGDLTAENTRQFHYDSEQRLNSTNLGVTSTAPVTRYAYNVLGERMFKTVPVLPSGGDLGNLPAFYARGWDPATVTAEREGFRFVYGEDGTLLGQYGTGGTGAVGTTQFIVLPTPNGQVPIAAIVDGAEYGIYSDHLNTPRRMINSAGNAVWQWGYSAFGDEPATTARFRFGNLETNPNPGTTTIADIAFNLRYPGQFYDSESKLHYNYFRSYKPDSGRYTQADPIGLDGGWNRFGYVDGNPLSQTDPLGLQRAPYSSPYGRPPAVPSTREMARHPETRPQAPRPATNTRQWEEWADMTGAATGGSSAGRHPGVPNAMEDLLNPQRDRTQPWVPTVPIPLGNGCTRICTPAREGICPATPQCFVTCGPVMSSR